MLRANELTKKINDRILFEKVSFEVKKGEIFAIVGPSGLGKSTLLRGLVGLEDFSSGTLTVAGKNYQPKTNQENIIGFVMQDFQLFPHLTVKENIVIGPRYVLKETSKDMKKKLDDLSEALELTPLLERYPSELSGGQKQRVAIARAMALESPILAYDEPTSALDSNLAEQVGTLLTQLKKRGITQIFVTHDLVFAKKFADVIFNLETKQECRL